MSSSKIDFLYLSEKDMLEAGVLDMAKCVETIESGFKALGQGDCVMGGPSRHSHGLKIWFPKETEHSQMPVAGHDRRFLAMPGYLGGEFHTSGCKWYGSNRDNLNKGLPRSILMFTLNDPDTGAPLAYMSANLLSATRTGAVPGVAAKYLSKKDAESIGVIGCGVISSAALSAIAEGMGRSNLRKIYLYDINPEQITKFIKKMEYLQAEFIICSSMEEAIKNSDIVSFATSGSNIEINSEHFKPGALVTFSGTGKLTDKALLSKKIVMDDKQMHRDAYLEVLQMDPQEAEAAALSFVPAFDVIRLCDEKHMNESEVLDLGEIALGRATGRKDDQEVIIFVSGGLPMEDIAWGTYLYKEAVRKGIGTKLNLWDQPHWS